MTVAELIEILKKVPQESDVLSEYTTTAGTVVSTRSYANTFNVRVGSLSKNVIISGCWTPTVGQ